MQAFKTLWQPRGNISIPKYDTTDGVDLQVKALVYMFKRLGIARSSDKLDLQLIPGVNAQDMENLDKLYNLEGFQNTICRDPHRVLVDWPKNRFRAMLIIAHLPQMEQLPQLNEPHFGFSVLEADASSDEYIRTLSRSDIYIEHNLPLEIRREIAASVVHRIKPDNLEERHAVILEYLRLAGTEIQVARIYKAMMSKVSPSHSPTQSPTQSPMHSPLHSPSHSPLHSPTHSPSHSRSASPTRSPPRPASPTRGGFSRFPKVAPAAAPKLSASPPKLSAQSPHQQPQPQGQQRLRLRTSQPNLKLAGTPNLNTPLNRSNDRTVMHSMDAGKKHILQQARLAVKARIDKEQKAILRNEPLRLE